jgi:hypothetical protein
MTEEAGCAGFEESSRRQERDEAKVGELTGLLQTIHGLVDPEDDVSFSGSGRLDEGKEGKTGETCGRVSADVNSNELTLGEGKGDGGAEIKILKVDRAEDGIVGDSGV